MLPICPECAQGKHRNCDGRAGINPDDTPIACRCVSEVHPMRTYRPPTNIVTSLEEFVKFDGEKLVPLLVPQPAPDNDPGIRADSFPELVEDGTDWMYNYRMCPSSDVISDLRDVEIMNPQGVWVPVVPSPLESFLGLSRCLCGKWRLGRRRYQEHYAYAHILGMED